jgi:Zn-dependent M28 family amino/carboxypeptidase
MISSFEDGRRESRTVLRAGGLLGRPEHRRRRPYSELVSAFLERASKLPLLAVVVLLCATGASATSSVPAVLDQRPELRVQLAGIREHLSALQEIADRNGGNRFAGTAGYDASARYVAQRMRAAGYRVRFQELAFPFVADRSPPDLRAVGAAGWSFRVDRDYATFAYSGSGEVEAPVAAVDLLVPSPRPNASTSGCEASDFASFPRGAIALLQRGTCTFREKAGNAVAAGASGVVVVNEGNPGRRGLFAGTLGTPQLRIPVLAGSFAVGEALRNDVRAGPTGILARLTTDVIAERRTTRNVLAESRAGNPANTVVVGAHLDSVESGPGINDNGSGSALILEVAEQLAQVRPTNRLRFSWWGAEEVGLLGSRHHVQRLTPAERRRIALYLNFDMVGSRNFVPFVYDGDGSSTARGDRAPPAGSAAIERVFASHFTARGLAYREASIGGGSDHAPFARARIPVGGLFTGAGGRKSAAQAAAFGGRAGLPYDACYHRACDTLANVSGVALDRIAGAAAHAIGLFARDVSAVRRGR